MGNSRAFVDRALKLAGACAPIAWLALSASTAQGQTASVQNLEKTISTYCLECHNTEDWAGELALDTHDMSHTGMEPAVWEATVNKMRGRLMPPAGHKQPSQSEVDALVGFLETSLDANASSLPAGHVPIQRLNRSEFAATIKALIGVNINTRQALPTEVEVEGFSNIASALAVSPAFMEQYLSTVRRAVRLAVGEPQPKMAKVFIPATSGQAAAYPLGTRGVSGRGGGVNFSHVFPADGEYRFNVPEEDFLDMGLYPRGAENPATLVILVDGVEKVRKEIGGGEYLDIADRDGPAGKKVLLDMVSSSAQITAGRHEVVFTYIDRSRALSNDAAGNGRVNTMPIIQTGIEIEGPFSPSGLSMNDSRSRIFVCQPSGPAEEKPCAEKITRHMVTQAFRRPATDSDVQNLMRFYELGRTEPGGFDAGITELVTAILSSPDFLYRVIPTSAKPDESRLLTDIELATRLSFLMWHTGPDQELINLAASRKLSDPAVMTAQVKRMLKDPRASTLVEDFALAWLNLDELDKVEPTDPRFNAAMRGNFETEIRLFLSSVLLEDRSVMDLLNANWTFVNDSLASHYDIQGVRGPQFRKVQLDNETRFGILGKGAFLLRTSYGDRTSPVLRGAWVLEKLMGTPPAPPPPNVNTDIAVKDGEAPTTVRARLEVHRQSPNCNACHGLIDPPGLALENFDNTGRWRNVDAAARGAAIDASTVLTSGMKLNGPVELRRFLANMQDQFPQTVTRRLMMYAMNREVEYFDMPAVRQIVKDAKKSNYRFSDILSGIVNSDAFRRQGPAEHQERVAMNDSGNPSAAAHP